MVQHKLTLHTFMFRFSLKKKYYIILFTIYIIITQLALTRI